MKQLIITFPENVMKLTEQMIEPKLQKYYFKVINDLWYRHCSSNDEWFKFSTKTGRFPSGPRDQNGKQHNASTVVQFLRRHGLITRSEHAPTPANIEYYKTRGVDIPKHIPHYSNTSKNTSIKYNWNDCCIEYEIDRIKVIGKDLERLSSTRISTECEFRKASVQNLKHFTCETDILEELVPDDADARSVSRAFNAGQQFNFGGYFGTEGKNVSRVYNNLTTMPRWSRASLRICDECIAEVDFACFQPRILAALCDPSFRNRFSNIINKLVGDVEWPVLTEEEISIIFDDDFYSKLGERDKIKKGMVIYMFGPAHRKNNVFQQGLERVFPKLHELAKQIKSKKCSKVINKDHRSGKTVYYGSMARLLQNLEAEIVFNILGRVLMEEDIVFSTIHDAFIIAESDMDKVKEKVQEKLEAEGIMPFGKILTVTNKVYR